jgi:hypothetical protein
MISLDAHCTVARIPLSCIHVAECQERYFEQLQRYVQLLKEHPQNYLGFLSVQPSGYHPGMFELLDGHHRFCAYIMAGRADALCVVIDDQPDADATQTGQSAPTESPFLGGGR